MTSAERDPEPAWNGGSLKAAAAERLDASAVDPLRSMAERVRDVCPYLLSEDGASRRLGPWRGHRCAALQPPSRLALDKQRRLCLVAEHLTCPTYVAARSHGAAAGQEAVAGPDLERVTRWSITRTTPAVVEPGSRLDGLASRLSGTAAQAILGAALLVALLAMARGQFNPAAAPNGSPSPGPTASIVATPSARPGATPAATATPVAAATPSATPLPVPTAVPTPSPRPTGSTTYVVRSGDSLWAIAVRFNTTVKAIQELNGLGSNTILHVGQRLEIP